MTVFQGFRANSNATADSSVVSNNKKCRSPGGGIDQRESKPIETNPALNKVEISTFNDLRSDAD